MEDNNSVQKRFYPARLDPDDPHRITLVPISEEQYHALLPPIWKHQRRMQRKGMCSCTKQSTWKCDADCELCEFKTAGLVISVEESSELSVDLKDSASNDPSDIVSRQIMLNHILARLGDLFPEALTVGRWIQSGLTQQEAIHRLGMKRSTFQSRVKKAERIICKELGIEDIKVFF